jgi:hypothetical protein
LAQPHDTFKSLIKEFKDIFVVTGVTRQIQVRCDDLTSWPIRTKQEKVSLRFQVEAEKMLVVTHLSSNCFIAWIDILHAGLILLTFPAKVQQTKLNGPCLELTLVKVDTAVLACQPVCPRSMPGLAKTDTLKSLIVEIADVFDNDDDGLKPCIAPSSARLNNTKASLLKLITAVPMWDLTALRESLSFGSHFGRFVLDLASLDVALICQLAAVCYGMMPKHRLIKEFAIRGNTLQHLHRSHASVLRTRHFMLEHHFASGMSTCGIHHMLDMCHFLSQIRTDLCHFFLISTNTALICAAFKSLPNSGQLRAFCYLGEYVQFVTLCQMRFFASCIILTFVSVNAAARSGKATDNALCRQANYKVRATLWEKKMSMYTEEQ